MSFPARLRPLAVPRTLMGGLLAAGGRRPYAAGMAPVVKPAFWRALIPRPLRRESGAGGQGARAREWNPATYFIVLFLFIGSMSIQQLTLRKQMERYSRQSAVRIELLRETVEKLRRGEEVDVEKVLGSGDAEKEAEWEQVIEAIERDERPRKSQTAEEVPRRRDEAKTTEVSSSKLDAGKAREDGEERKGSRLGNFF